MHFGLSPEQEQFRKDVVAFLDEVVTPEAVAEWGSGLGAGPAANALYRKLGERRWLTLSWPEKYGGLERSHMDQLILSNELSYRRIPPNRVSSSMAGPTIIMFGSEEIKQEFLPRISRGEIEFALGYTEPDAGSDLASLSIRAIEDGDDYVINGAKIFNTHTHFANYHWLGARTNTETPKHRGVSLFIVDLKSPGITIKPLITFGGTRTNVVYYDNVRISKRYLVGQKDRGFYHIATALDFERQYPMGGIMRDMEELVTAVEETSLGGKPLRKDPLVRQKVAELAAEVEAATLLSYRMAWQLDNGIVPNYEASMLKLYASELQHRIATAETQIFGLSTQLRRTSKWSAMDGKASHLYLNAYTSTIVMGTSEIQRNIIATRGLGLPR